MVSLFMGLGLLVVLYFGLQSPYITGGNEKPPKFEKGNIFFPKKIVASFNDKYQVSGNADQYEKSIAECIEILLGAIRSEYTGYSSLNAKWLDAFKFPYLYTGVLMPVKPKSVEDVSGQFNLPWPVVKVTIGDGEIFVHLSNKSEKIVAEELYFLDLFYLGNSTIKGQSGHHGVAERLYLLPDRGILPKMTSDKEALSRIVDEMELPEETRQVTEESFQHYMSKVQTGEDKETPALEGVGYGKMMDTPDRYRGKIVEVDGVLIHYIKKRLWGTHIQPGMEFYYQCYLLDKNRLEYMVRTFELPVDVQPKERFYAKGYFLQRTNFLNRDKKVMWAPLIVANEMRSFKDDSMKFSHIEKVAVVSFLVLVITGLVLVVAFQKKPPPKQRGPLLKVKKKPKDN